MSLLHFFCGFGSCLGVIAFIFLWGAKKGRQTLDQHLAGLVTEQKKNRHKVKAAGTLELTRVTSSAVVVNAVPHHTANKFDVCKIVLQGSTLTIYHPEPLQQGGGGGPGSGPPSPNNNNSNSTSGGGSGSPNASNSKESPTSGEQSAQQQEEQEKGGSSANRFSLLRGATNAAATQDQVWCRVNTKHCTCRLQTNTPYLAGNVLEITTTDHKGSLGSPIPRERPLAPASGGIGGDGDGDDHDSPKYYGAGSDWKVLHLRFETARELDRWYNVLNPTPRTGEWRVFLRAMPEARKDDIFNLFLGRIFFENSSTPELRALIMKKISKKLTAVKLPGDKDSTICCNDVDPGSQLPLLYNVSNMHVSVHGEVAFDFDLHYRGGFFIQLCIALCVKGLHLPAVIVSVTVEEIKGRVHLSVGAPPSDKMWIAFHEKPVVQLSFKQELHTSKDNSILGQLVNRLPDLSDLISDTVKVKLFEDMILPNMDDLPLPNVADTPPPSPKEDPLLPPSASSSSHLHQQPHKQPASATVASAGSSSRFSTGTTAATATAAHMPTTSGPAALKSPATASAPTSATSARQSPESNGGSGFVMVNKPESGAGAGGGMTHEQRTTSSNEDDGDTSDDQQQEQSHSQQQPQQHRGSAAAKVRAAVVSKGRTIAHTADEVKQLMHNRVADVVHHATGTGGGGASAPSSSGSKDSGGGGGDAMADDRSSTHSLASSTGSAPTAAGAAGSQHVPVGYHSKYVAPRAAQQAQWSTGTTSGVVGATTTTATTTATSSDVSRQQQGSTPPPAAAASHESATPTPPQAKKKASETSAKEEEMTEMAPSASSSSQEQGYQPPPQQQQQQQQNPAYAAPQRNWAQPQW